MSQLDDYITAANNALNAGRNHEAITDVLAYYEAQPSRGYSALAIGLIKNNGGWANAAANDEIINAVGATLYSTYWQATLAVQLATQDNYVRNFDINTGTNGSVVSANQIANYHYQVLSADDINPLVWGGACLAGLHDDWSLGGLTPAETTGRFANNTYATLPQAQVEAACSLATTAGIQATSPNRRPQHGLHDLSSVL